MTAAGEQLPAPRRLAKALRDLADLRPDELRRLADVLDALASHSHAPRGSLRQRVPVEQLTADDFDAAAHQERRNGIELLS